MLWRFGPPLNESPAMQPRGSFAQRRNRNCVCSHHAQAVSRGFCDSRWRQAWKRPRPNCGCVRASRSICGDQPLIRGHPPTVSWPGWWKAIQWWASWSSGRLAFGNVPAHFTQSAAAARYTSFPTAWVSCVAGNVAQSGPGAGVGGQTWLAVEKIKSHQVEYRGSRLCAQCAGQINERTSTIAGRLRFMLQMASTLSLSKAVFRCRTMCSGCRLPQERSARCLVVRAAGWKGG